MCLPILYHVEVTPCTCLDDVLRGQQLNWLEQAEEMADCYIIRARVIHRHIVRSEQKRTGMYARFVLV